METTGGSGAVSAGADHVSRSDEAPLNEVTVARLLSGSSGIRYNGGRCVSVCECVSEVVASNFSELKLTTTNQQTNLTNPTNHRLKHA